MCNPYIEGTIKLECAVTGTNIAKIQWYFSSTNSMNMFDESDVVEITNSSKYSLRSSDTREQLSVMLTIHNLSEDDDTGSYWCRGFLLDGRWLSSPDSFVLKTSDMYSNIVCPDVTFKNTMLTCAQVYVSPAITTYSTNELTTDNIHTTEYLKETIDITTVATPAPPEMHVLYIIIGMIAFLTAMCLLLAFVICLLCKRVRNKGKLLVSTF